MPDTKYVKFSPCNKVQSPAETTAYWFPLLTAIFTAYCQCYNKRRILGSILKAHKCLLSTVKTTDFLLAVGSKHSVVNRRQ